MKSCVPCGKYILAVFVMRKIKEIVVFLMINSMCSLCRIRYGNFFVFVVDGVRALPRMYDFLESYQDPNGPKINPEIQKNHLASILIS